MYEDQIKILELGASALLPRKVSEDTAPLFHIYQELVEGGYLKAVKTSSHQGFEFINAKITPRGRDFLNYLKTRPGESRDGNNAVESGVPSIITPAWLWKNMSWLAWGELILLLAFCFTMGGNFSHTDFGSDLFGFTITEPLDPFSVDKSTDLRKTTQLQIEKMVSAHLSEKATLLKNILNSENEAARKLLLGDRRPILESILRQKEMLKIAEQTFMTEVRAMRAMLGSSIDSVLK